MEKTRRQKITSIILGVTLLFVVFAGFVRFSHKMQKSNDEYAQKTLNEIVSLQKNSISTKLTADMNFLENVSELFTTEYFTNEQIISFIQTVKLNHSFAQLLLYYEDGTVITADQSAPMVSFEDISEQFSTTEPICFEPSESIIDGTFVQAMAYPIYDKAEGKVSYVLVGVHSLEMLQDYVENTFNENGNIGVLNSNGELVFSNQLTEDTVYIRKEYLKNVFTVVETEKSEADVIADFQENKSDFFLYRYGKNEIYFAYEPLGINDWYIGVHLNKESLTARSDLVSRDAFGFLLTLAVCILILSAYINYQDRCVKKELYSLAFFDKLTGLSNGEHFKIQLQKTLDEYPKKEFFCIVFDICNFKLINDRYGYEVGDEMLREIANTVNGALARTFLTGTYCLGKLHSDTYISYIPASTQEECNGYMRRLIELIHENTDLKNEYSIDFSLGRYTTQQGDTADVAVERALNAHSHAKKEEPNKFIDFNNLIIRELHNRADILNCFDEAIANHEFQLYFQPQFSALTRQVHGVEILVRWIKDGKFRYTPDVFVPVLEETGRISKLDGHLREMLCVHIRDWLDRGIELPHFSVNVSRAELVQPDFVFRMKTLLEKYEIPPAMIHIELTETAYIEDQDKLVNKIVELQKHGFLMEMDDFGSGYSSLNVLKDMPVDVVKLDMKFIEEGTFTARSSNILASIVGMARSINLITIAEGVETEEQVTYLESIGCNYLQGYFFAKPMPSNDFEVLLENYKVAPVKISEEQQD